MITINLYYTGENGSARAFAEEMVRSGTAAAIREEDGNLRYEYFFPMDDPVCFRRHRPAGKRLEVYQTLRRKSE